MKLNDKIAIVTGGGTGIGKGITRSLGEAGARVVIAQSTLEKAEDAELFLYPGDQHYFADSSLPSYDATATALLTKRVLAFLGRI